MAGGHPAIWVCRRDCTEGSDHFLYRQSLVDPALELQRRTAPEPTASSAAETFHPPLAWRPACRSRLPTSCAGRKFGPVPWTSNRTPPRLRESATNERFAFTTPDQSSNAGTNCLPSARISFSRSITLEPDLAGKPMIVTLSPKFNVRRVHPCLDNIPGLMLSQDQ